jgi:hypothetical protein
MKPQALDDETTLQSNLVDMPETATKVEPLKELAEFELAYVGGGMAAVIFQ